MYESTGSSEHSPTPEGVNTRGLVSGGWYQGGGGGEVSTRIGLE